MRHRSRQLRFAWACSVCVGVACGGVAQEQHAPPLAQAGARAEVDAGALDAAPENDAASMADASIENDAGATEACPSDTVSCCDSWTGASSRPTCVDGYTQCGGRLELQAVDSACVGTSDACHVASAKELDGQVCSPDASICRFGRGCSSCFCKCQDSTLLWRCECTPC